jgi:hypothetical protein
MVGRSCSLIAAVVLDCYFVLTTATPYAVLEYYTLHSYSDRDLQPDNIRRMLYYLILESRIGISFL